MKIVKNQKGLTLIEVLATLAIMSLLIGAVYGVFINGLNASSKAQVTTALQQEANYVLTVLKNQQEKQQSYTINVVTDSNSEKRDRKIIIINLGKENQFNIANPKYSYQLCDLDNLEDPNNLNESCKKQYNSNFSILIDNTNTKRLHVQIKITDYKNPDDFIEVKTIFSRL